ncbi:hypothetical protein BC829DRAFT_493440 [Chytridium lagenaria]|nr:hypothetical protein BC829DRAFT_493440 [Chytridium lagenaria]
MVSSTLILASFIASIAIVNATPTSPPKCDNFYCKLVPSPDGPTCGSDGQQYMNGCIFEASQCKDPSLVKVKCPSTSSSTTAPASTTSTTSTTIISKTSTTVTATTSTAMTSATSSCTTLTKTTTVTPTTSCRSSVTATTLPTTITSVKPTMTNIIESGAAATGRFSGQTAIVVLVLSVFALF